MPAEVLLKETIDIFDWDEQVKIHIGVGGEVYTYIVNPKGALLDTQDITIFWNPNAKIWNSTATAAARTNQDGWQFEIEIPLEALNIDSANYD